MKRGIPLVGRGNRRHLVLAFVLVGLVMTGPAPAQTVERDPPVAFANEPSVIAPPNLDAVLADETPIEGPLTGLVFLSETDDVLRPSDIAPGIDTSRVALLDDPVFLTQVTPYLGQPVSLKMVAEIEAEVANWARGVGMPFVSISTPEQEITGGVLQFRVQEFRVGQRQADAQGRMSEDQALAGVRVQSGDKINSDMLAEDLGWLSRSPFRDATADFAPGAAIGETDMTVRILESKPWLVSASVDTYGARSTGETRLRSAVILGDLVVPGSVLTLQVAASPDVFTKGVAGLGGHPSYQSEGGDLFLPTLPRQAIEAAFSAIESNSFTSPFDVRSMITEGKLGYRLLASELGLPPGWGEVFAGTELRRVTVESRFGGALAASNSADIVQFYAGWTNTIADDDGRTTLGATLRLSPGGLTGDNTGAAFSASSSGRVTDARYAYLEANINRQTTLPYDFSLTNNLQVQLATGPLIDTEQMSVGGNAAVRGYLPDDGAYDQGLILRNTLSYAPLEWNGTVTPFVLGDIGFGHNARTGGIQTLASVGAGFDFSLPGGGMTGSLTGALALTDSTVTKSGNFNITFSASGRY